MALQQVSGKVPAEIKQLLGKLREEHGLNSDAAAIIWLANFYLDHAGQTSKPAAKPNGFRHVI